MLNLTIMNLIEIQGSFIILTIMNLKNPPKTKSGQVGKIRADGIGP